MKQLQLTITLDMADSADVTKLAALSAILTGGTAGTISDSGGSPVTDVDDTPTETEAKSKAPKSKAPKSKAPTKKTEATEIPTAAELAEIKTEVGNLITKAVSADNPKSAANSALIGGELKRLGAAKVSMLSPDKLPGLLAFLTENVK